MTLCRLGIAGNRPRPEEGLVSGGKNWYGGFFWGDLGVSLGPGQVFV
jgi:hypothetical protein